ncbi:hypothetical protein ACLQ2P_31655 [Actinomadura citrea]|uniref:hypothetical protein n=1 Tax=Actinomadura citrea TaxID=46158 RepID=UPI003CE4C847
MSTLQSFAVRAEVLLNRLAQVEAQEADQQANAEIERTRQRVKRTREALGEALHVIPVLAESGITPPAIPNGTAANLAKARTALRSAATAIVGAPVGDIATRLRSQSVNTALETADKLARSLVADLNRSVDRKRLQLQPEGIEQPIVVYPGASDALAVRLNGIQSRLQQKVDGLNPSQLEQRLESLVRDAASWIADRPALERSLEGQHPEVQEFLRLAATEQGASWRLVTPTVQGWLQDPENTVNLRVVLRS